MTDLSAYGPFGLLLLLGVVLGILPVVAPLFLAPRSRGTRTRETYECGVDTEGSAWVRFDVAYYLFALIFVVFEVDVLYILPVAVVFGEAGSGWRDLVELLLFVGILGLAVIYAWRRGVLHWRA